MSAYVCIYGDNHDDAPRMEIDDGTLWIRNRTDGRVGLTLTPEQFKLLAKLAGELGDSDAR